MCQFLVLAAISYNSHPISYPVFICRPKSWAKVKPKIGTKYTQKKKDIEMELLGLFILAMFVKIFIGMDSEGAQTLSKKI